ncbi:MAG: hypothetical protein JWQ93_1982 [Marmoricola sp.]|nr:hypothetical protein [Marmoricola sp.]
MRRLTHSVHHDSRAGRRLVAAVGLSAGAVVAAVVMPSGALGAAGDSGDGYKKAYDAATSIRRAAAQGSGTIYLSDGSHLHPNGLTDGGTHDHNDPTTKNAISRSATVTTAATADPTTPDQARRAADAAATQRAQSEPKLSSVAVSPAHSTTPSDVYNMFNACYGVQSTRTGRWLAAGTTPSFTATTIDAAEPLYFKPTTLGRYLLYSRAGTFLDAAQPAVSYTAGPGPTADWVASMPSNGVFKLAVPGKGSLTDSASRATVTGSGTPLRLQLRSGCTEFPEVSTNVTGNPFSGVSSSQEVRGFIDAHTHGMAFEFLGGDVHCGRPWSPYGVTVALRDCPDHELTGGKGALVEAFLSNKPTHDPVGWPTFKDWPAPDSLTHEGTYYKWMERSWRAGQRILVNLLVENNKLCEIYPLKRNSCNDMDSIRLQAKDMRDLERYIDAQNGGPGKGWYRIVTTPDEARRVINAGKLAVVMGIETSVPFDCTQKLGVPDLRCSKASIDRQLDEVRKLGVSQMELVNKFDNALSGVAGDTGATGYLVNGANTLETGSPWRMQTCNPNDAEVHDRDQDNSVPLSSGDLPSQDALFGAIAKFSGVTLPALPVYPAPHHCNSLGLTELGAHTIRGLARRHMLFDPDHMSVKARQASLDLVESMGYSGVLSSHSWSTPDAYSRIYRDKGFITPYAGDSTGFVEKWRRHLTWANPGTYWGIGFGADINGLGAQGNPRPNAANDRPVTYPFTTLGGVKVHQQVSGRRVYDINRDGVAHYGLYPDWIQDLKMQAGDDIVKDLARGPEAYLQMWERAFGVQPNACSNPGARLSPSVIQSRVRPGMTSWATLQAIGQPDRRLGNVFTYCSTGGTMKVDLDAAGRVVRVVRA